MKQRKQKKLIIPIDDCNRNSEETNLQFTKVFSNSVYFQPKPINAREAFKLIIFFLGSIIFFLILGFFLGGFLNAWDRISLFLKSIESGSYWAIGLLVATFAASSLATLLAAYTRLYSDDINIGPSECQKAFGIAAQYGDLDVMKLLITQFDIDAAVNQNNAIRCAIQHQRYKALEFLVSQPGVNAVPSNADAAACSYALGIAAQNGHLKVVRFLVAQPGVDAAAYHNYAIQCAIEHNHYEVVSFLATQPGVKEVAFKMTTLNCNNILLKAVESGDLNVVEILVTRGKIDAATCFNLLTRAVKHGYLEVAVFLVTLPGVNTAAAIWYATRHHRSDIVKAIQQKSISQDTFLASNGFKFFDGATRGEIPQDALPVRGNQSAEKR